MNVTKNIFELKRKLVEAVNASNLPPAVVELVMGGIHAELLQLVEKELSEGGMEDGPVQSEK